METSRYEGLGWHGNLGLRAVACGFGIETSATHRAGFMMLRGIAQHRQEGGLAISALRKQQHYGTSSI